MTDAADIAAKQKLSPKDEVRALLDRLPDDVTLEDIQYHLDVVVKVLEAEADPGPGIPHEEVLRRFRERWPELEKQGEGFTEEDCDHRFVSGSSGSKAGQ